MVTAGLLVALTVFPLVPAAAQPSVPQVGLEPSEVPGFTPIDRSVQTYQDPSDAGVDQAFISCAGTDPLLSQYDEGGDSSISQVYGQGDNGYGAPALSVASVVFGSSTASEVDGAYAKLASQSFQQCWLTGIDSLNQAQGAVTPTTPSTLSSLSMPALGSAATGYLMHWNLSAGGSPLTGEFGVSVVKTGPYVVALFTLAWNSSFPDATRQAILKEFVGRIGGSTPAPTTTTTTTVPVVPPPPAPSPAVACQPAQPPAGDAATGARLAQTSVNNQDLNSGSGDQTVTSALQVVYQHRNDPEFLVGFVNALDTRFVIGWLSFDSNGQPLAPQDYDPTGTDPTVIGQVSDWYLKEFETAAATCQLTRDTAYGFLSGIDDLQARLQTLSQDPDAARGLMIHLSWQDIMQAPQSLEVPAYSEFAASAIAAGTEISVLAPPPWSADPAAHFSLQQALALELKAQFTSDGQSTLTSALTRYAQTTEPSPPPPQQLGALAAGNAYTTWATEIGDIQWAISVQYAAEIAAGWQHPTVAEWYTDLGHYDDLPGATADFSEEGNVEGATDYVLLLERLLVKWLQYEAHASELQQQAQANAARWLCGREPQAEAMLFLSMLHSNRLLYTVDDSRTAPAPLTNGVTIEGLVVDFDPGQFPPLPQASGGSRTDYYNNIEALLRPPAGTTFGSLLADSAGQTTGLSARVPFDSVVWSWEQKLSQAGSTACAIFPSVPAINPTSGIGSAIMVTGSGYAPNTAVTITGHSKPVLLATAWTNASGQFAAFVNPGDRLPRGAHQIIASGQDPRGVQRVLRWPIQVGGTPARSSRSSVARMWPEVVLAGLVVVLVGGGVVGLRRRRRRRWS